MALLSTNIAPAIGTHWRWAPLKTFAKWFALARQRQALAQLDATQLADIGLTLKEAQIEADRPFWDAPSHWHS